MGTFQTAFTFNKGVLTNGSQLPGQDYITGLLFYGSAPTGFPSSKVKNMFSVQDAVNVGITNTHDGETKSTATYLVTAAGAAGDVVVITVQEPINPINQDTNPNKITLCTYTVLASDTTATILAASLATAIQANQAATGGYTATSSSGTLTITARGGLGVALNSGTPYAVTITGTVAGTLTQNVVAGVASIIDVWYYHISEYFRMNPNGNLWVGVFADSGTTYTELTTLQQASVGAIRQVGVYRPTRTIVANGTTDANTLNTVAQALDNNKMPLSVVLSGDISAVTDLTTLPNLSLLNDEWVSINISQDGAAQGWALFQAYGKSITNLGALMGCISVAQVSADIAQPIPQFNISDGTENNVAAFANSQTSNLNLFTNVSVGVQTVLDNYRYIYSGNYVGYTGTYFSDDHCAIISNSNYAYIDQNRVEAKIERLMYQAYLPVLKSQIQLNADGTIFAPLISSLESLGDNILNINMVSNGELSAIRTVINPRQNITAQGGLVVTLYEVNNPIARKITINVNSVTSIPA
jgi:hypothetical protein